MGLFPLITTMGFSPVQGRVVPAPCAALGTLLRLRDEDGKMLEKPSKGAGGSGRDVQPRGASETTWFAWLFFAFFPLAFMFTQIKVSKEVPVLAEAVLPVFCRIYHVSWDLRLF